MRMWLVAAPLLPMAPQHKPCFFLPLLIFSLHFFVSVAEGLKFSAELFHAAQVQRESASTAEGRCGISTSSPMPSLSRRADVGKSSVHCTL